MPSYESRSTRQPSFLIEISEDAVPEYAFSMDEAEWHDTNEMQLVANMLVQTFGLGATGHDAGIYSIAELIQQLRTLLDVPMEHRFLFRSGGRWRYTGPVYDEKGALVPERGN